MQEAASVRAAYELDDLSAEWTAVLNQIDDLLFQVLLSLLSRLSCQHLTCSSSMRSSGLTCVTLKVQHTRPTKGGMRLI